ncbi:hypothetical protein GX50_02213 [[Emmonsia] crescens]|uniref:Uncharacterized protein n=1 Tax=[Emmonsia] crescens TaxID=73230 RepID=A0A2B7ZP62_9EURO|nr:hypothetical protein GX50_02213 [Emmonsia crescens]
MYDPPDSPSDSTEYPCQEYENRTLEISMNAIAGFLEISPKAYPTPNPFYFSIEAWDKHYNLSAGTGTTQRKSPNYTEYQEIHAYTGRTTPDYGPIWLYNVTNAPSISTGDDDEVLYRFDGRMNAVDFLRDQSFKFNASGICNERDEKRLLFSGSLLSPRETEEHDWAGSPIPAPRISGYFNTRTAHVAMSGLFRAGNGQRGTIVGRAEMVFHGEIDAERSDQLFMGRAVPEWNATLGFARGSVGGGKSTAPRISGTVASLILIGFMGIGLAVPLIFF